ncbi:MAG: Fe-S cluster assembly protein SufB, partial [Spirochaetales bacterium]|nr:Fe-S cluster assembly protein SufB [Spirochaetales bacterium]
MSISEQLPLEEYEHGYYFPDQSVFKTKKGLDEDVVRAISNRKDEPEWMLNYRLKAYETFLKKDFPNWGADIGDINFDEIYYYAKPVDKQPRSWADVPDAIQTTFERIVLPDADRN